MKPIINLTKINLILILFAAFSLACSKDEKNDPPVSNPVLSVKLVDSPSSYDAVNVEIIGLEANTGYGWISLAMDHTGVFNLLTFTNGSSLPLMNDTVMNPFTMTELRMILGLDNSVVVGGIPYELQTPSGQTSGYKVKMDPQQLVAGGIYHLVLDFNAEQSVHLTGSGKYMLKPVVQGFMENTIGAIAGTISPVNGAYYVEAMNATDTAGTYIMQSNGQFLLSTVKPGTYNVKVFPNGGYIEKSVPDIVVVAGQTSQMGTVMIYQIGGDFQMSLPKPGK